MITQIKIEKCNDPYCVIHTEKETDGIKNIAEKIRTMDESGQMVRLSGWDGDYCIQVNRCNIFRIYSMDKKVYLETEKETLLFKMRLYEFEELAKRYGWTDFIRISNTDIVNFLKVTKLDMSLTGVIKVNFINGKNAIVSRRYMSKIKKDLLNIHRH